MQGCSSPGLLSRFAVGAPSNSSMLWNPVIERLEPRLAGWRKQFLSKGGRLTLVKSTLSSLPTYFMSLFVIPVSVANKPEKLERDFLWEGSIVERKYHLVNWSSVCSNVRVGGLGIKKLRMFNMALLGKWMWRYMIERDALWKREVQGKDLEFIEGERGSRQRP